MFPQFYFITARLLEQQQNGSTFVAGRSMVVHTRLRERKERERKKEREERCNRRRNALNTITGFSTMFYLTKQTRSMNHPGTHDTKSLFDFGTLCVCVCVYVRARPVTTWAGWAMMQLSSPRKKCTTPLAIQQLDWCEFFKQPIQSGCEVWTWACNMELGGVD